MVEKSSLNFLQQGKDWGELQRRWAKEAQVRH